MTDHEVVADFPRKKRGTKYPLDEWFNGKVHRLVPGRDFHIKESSLKTTLYNLAKDHNFDVKIQWEEEFDADGNTIMVAYVGPKPPKADQEKA